MAQRSTDARASSSRVSGSSGVKPSACLHASVCPPRTCTHTFITLSSSSEYAASSLQLPPSGADAGKARASMHSIRSAARNPPSTLSSPLVRSRSRKGDTRFVIARSHGASSSSSAALSDETDISARPALLSTRAAPVQTAKQRSAASCAWGVAPSASRT
eukprot:6191029-Pleurochrysis_carterae.AAC.7